jgi:hypothetical protein
VESGTFFLSARAAHVLETPGERGCARARLAGSILTTLTIWGGVEANRAFNKDTTDRLFVLKIACCTLSVRGIAYDITYSTATDPPRYVSTS